MTEDLEAAKASIERIGSFLLQPLSSALACLASNDVFDASSGSLCLGNLEAIVPADWIDWLRTIEPANHDATLKRLASESIVALQALST